MADPQHTHQKPVSRPQPSHQHPEVQSLDVDSIEQALQTPTSQSLTPAVVMRLQQTIGNQAVQRIISHMADNTVQRDGHERGCSCPNCRQIQRQVESVQRDGVKDRIKALEKNEVTSAFEPATLLKDDEMTKLAKKLDVTQFKALTKSKTIAAKDTIIALIKYFNPVSLGDLDSLIGEATDADKKAVWSNSALLTTAEGKLGKDPYLTFVTRLGMHQPPTTDELGEGGAEHTPAPKADEIIRDKMSAYVTEAVKKGKKIEGQVAVVAGDDWDRAGVAHYGRDVWFNAVPTPKKDAINGFVDGKGRVWVERNSGNPGTVIHEGLHKYSADTVLNKLGFNTNEGMTEYFTRLICDDLGIVRGNYTNQHDLITALATTATTKQIVASAYFDGEVNGLRKAFIKYRIDTKGDKRSLARKIWDAFVHNFKNGNWGNVLQCINDDLDTDDVKDLLK